MLLPYGREHQLPEGSVVQGISPDQLVLNNKYLVEKPSELFLNGQYSAEKHFAQNRIDRSALLSGTYSNTAVDAPIKLGLYGIAKAQKIYVDCLMNNLYATMPDDELRDHARRDTTSQETVLDSAFLDAPFALHLNGLVRYRRQVVEYVRTAVAAAKAKANAAKAKANAAKAAKAKANANVVAARRANAEAAHTRNEAIRAERRRAMEAGPASASASAATASATPPSSWFGTMGKMLTYVPRVVAGGTRKQKRVRKVE
jgi:hypothetical protein